MENNNQQINNKIIKIGATLKVDFVSLSHEGLGIAKINGLNQHNEYYENFPIFVSGALPKESGIIQITKLTKTYGFGELVKIFPDTYSLDRTTPICKNYPTCGGCNIMHMNYKAQLRFKEQMVKETLERIGCLDNVKVESIIGAKNPIYYRNKVQVPVGQENNKTIAGFYKRDTHHIIPLDKCYIQPSFSTEVTQFIKNLLNEYKLVGYDERLHKGDIRHILVKSNIDGEMMIVIVALHEIKNHLDMIVKKITTRYPLVKSIVLNINKARGNTILGDTNILLYGDKFITDTLCGKKFILGATSFYQVNHEQTETLYTKALELAHFTKTDTIIDAYCGIGTIGIIASKDVKEVYGVEIVKEAIENAKINLSLNKVENATYVVGKAEEQIVKWMHDGLAVTGIVVDPPRKGCDEALLETIKQMKISKVLYISCNPATLARDLKYLTQNGYTIQVVQPIDMFPQSSHVETIVVLQANK